MTVDDALYRMELVGHDFYLFIDAETDRPSVVYRRKGWDYGVIGLDVEDELASQSRPKGCAGSYQLGLLQLSADIGSVDSCADRSAVPCSGRRQCRRRQFGVIGGQCS